MEPVNCEIRIEKGKATITIDLTKEYGRSSTGKTITIAKCQERPEGYEGVTIQVNAYKKAS